ncbi:MAG: hypothetical protein KC983_04790, partial [Phycisphaerales bacterium]|nr:hypothetical protein [Phycisphaerales bacterium]
VRADDQSGRHAVDPVFEMHIEFETPDVMRELRSGQRMDVRVSLPSRPLAAQWWRALRQMVQRRFQI